jgi:hypothetical protein
VCAERPVGDLPVAVAAALGVDTRCPSESTIRRLLDAVIGSFVEQLCAEPPPAGRRRVLAVDGKTLCVRHEVACSEWITVEEVPVVVT